MTLADHGLPVGGPEIERYLQIARSHWGVPAPVCHTPDGQAIAVHAVLYDDPDRGVSARAELPGCRIWLDRDYWPRPLDRIDCTIVVHEWGHLLGHGHDPNRDSLMHELPTGGAPGCALLTAGRARSDHGTPVRGGKPRARVSPHLKKLRHRRAVRRALARRRAVRLAKRRCAYRLRGAKGSRRSIERKRIRCVRRSTRR